MPATDTATVRRWLVAGVLLANAFVFALAGVALYDNKLQLREHAYLTAGNLSWVLERGLAALVRDVDNAILAVVEEINRERAAGGIDKRGLEDFIARRTVRLPEMLGMRVDSAEGIIEVPTNAMEDPATTLAGHSYFFRLRDDPASGLLISQPMMDRLTAKWVIVLVTLRRLKELGVKLSIDDFGTGYCSLAYLKRFAVDKLKIDQSFVCNLTSDPDQATIVRAIVQMAQSLGLRTIAEGVEEAKVVDCLRRHGCDEVQGYLLGRPMPAANLTRYLSFRLEDWLNAAADGVS
jgi:hypothetical protein